MSQENFKLDAAGKWEDYYPTPEEEARMEAATAQAEADLAKGIGMGKTPIEPLGESAEYAIKVYKKKPNGEWKAILQGSNPDFKEAKQLAQHHATKQGLANLGTEYAGAVFDEQGKVVFVFGDVEPWKLTK